MEGKSCYVCGKKGIRGGLELDYRWLCGKCYYIEFYKGEDPNCLKEYSPEQIHELKNLNRFFFNYRQKIRLSK